MFCPNCGTQHPDGTNCCTNCGYQFHKPAPQAEPVYEAQPTQQAAPVYQPEPVYQQPVYQPQPTQQAEPVYQPQPEPVYQPQPEPVYQPQPEPVYQPVTPAYTPEPAQTAAPAAKKPSSFGKVAGKLVWITFILTVLLVGLSIYTAMSTDLFDMPVVEWSFQLVSNDVEEILADSLGDTMTEDMEEEIEDIDSARDIKKVLEDVFNPFIKNLEDFSDDLEDVLDRDEKRLLDDVVEAADNTMDTMSLLNLHSFVSILDENASDLEAMEEDYDVTVEVSGVEQGVQFINIAIIVVAMLFVLPLVFTVIGGLSKSKGLTITALVFLVLPQLLLCGPVWVLLSLVLFILQAVLCGKARKARLEAEV